MNRTIKPDDLKPLLGSVVLLDVRRRSDYDADKVKLPGTRWMDPEKMMEWSDGLSRVQDVVVYCVRGGSVSNSVVDHLQSKGIKACFIEGGIEAWKQAGGETDGK